MAGCNERAVAGEGVESGHDESSDDRSCSVMMWCEIVDSESDEDDDEGIDEESGCSFG